ncbi:hypothetical protein BGZ76_002871, partial [Entomortierella beljakovae]
PAGSSRSSSFRAFSVSETGEYIATLSFKDNKYQANIWRFQRTKGGGDEDSFQWIREIDLSPYKVTNFVIEPPTLRIAINSNGTQIAVFRSISDTLLASPDDHAVPQSEVSNINLCTIDFSTKWLISDQKSISRVGFGKYTTLLNGSEVFLYCDGLSVTVFNTGNMWFWQHWRQLHNISFKAPTIQTTQSLSSLSSDFILPWIQLKQKYVQKSTQHLTQIQGKVSQIIPKVPPPTVTIPNPPSTNVLLSAKDLIDGAQASLFTWLGDCRDTETNVVSCKSASIWSIEFGFMSAFIGGKYLPSITPRENIPGLPLSRRISRVAPHGRFMAIAHGKIICKYLLPSATIVGKIDLALYFSDEFAVIDIGFPETGPQILIFLQNGAKKIYLVELDVETQKLNIKVERPYDPTKHPTMLHNIYEEHSLPKLNFHIDSPTTSFDHQPAIVGDYDLIHVGDMHDKHRVKVTHKNQSWFYPESIGYKLPRDAKQVHKEISAEDQSKLERFKSIFVLAGQGYFLVWRLSERPDGCRLVAIIEPHGLTTSLSEYSISTLDHSLVFDIGRPEKITIKIDEGLPNGHLHGFDSRALSTLIKLYGTARGTDQFPDYLHYRRAIVRYVSEAFAQCSTWGSSKDEFLYELCHDHGIRREGGSEDDSYFEIFEEFFNDLVLGNDGDRVDKDDIVIDDYIFEHFRWISSFPTPGTNPIRLGIKETREMAHHHNIRFHKTLIKHCIKNAIREGDTSFLKPILECMDIILEDEKLALEIMGQLAYIPVPHSSRKFIVENSAVGERLSPLRFIPFYRQRASLCTMNKPTFRLRSPQKLDYKDRCFSDSLFVAPFGMLYRLAPKDANDRKDGKDSGIAPEHYDRSWRLGSRFKQNEHTFEGVDNPAVVALMQHLW